MQTTENNTSDRIRGGMLKQKVRKWREDSHDVLTHNCSWFHHFLATWLCTNYWTSFCLISIWKWDNNKNSNSVNIYLIDLLGRLNDLKIFVRCLLCTDTRISNKSINFYYYYYDYSYDIKSIIGDDKCFGDSWLNSHFFLNYSTSLKSPFILQQQ